LALAALRYDVVILDLALHEGDDLQWLHARRADGDFPPVLVLTGPVPVEIRVSALDAGADDLVIKPVDPAEISARLRALARRKGARSLPVLRVGSLTYDVAARGLHCNDLEVPLTRNEAEFIELMMRRAGMVVPKSVIADALYRLNDAVTPNAIEAMVSRLRNKLCGSCCLSTVRGVGYILRDSPTSVSLKRIVHTPRETGVIQE
jgi:two-component system response regulator QseB